MALLVHNTATGTKETFVPLREGHVGMYVCGVTVYDHSHVGHARSYVAFDVIRRYLEHKGFKVDYVQNFTDVDDKIINRANETGENPLAVSARFIESYYEDFDRLNVKRADRYPKASDHIPDMLAVISDLVAKGHAYVVDGDVYFSLESAKDKFGTLRHQSADDMLDGARVDVDDRKRSPKDFALWKSAKPGEISWDSPWGKGRPGWHIECSTMSAKYLGDTFDIHGGGMDLIFPHHESEILQSETHTGKPFAKYWLHNGFIEINHEKMSKSLGNFFTIKEILAKYDPMVLRFFLIYTHYRSPIDYSDASLEEASKSLDRLRRSYLDLRSAKGLPEGDGGELAQAAKDAVRVFEERMDDDFNTREAIAAAFDLARATNGAMSERRLDETGQKEALAAFETMWSVLGLRMEEKAGQLAGIESQLLDLLIEVRESARKRRDFATSDAIRDGLKKLGVVIEDSNQGAKWRKGEKP